MKLNEKEENIYEIFKNWFYQDNMLINVVKMLFQFALYNTS